MLSPAVMTEFALLAESTPALVWIAGADRRWIFTNSQWTSFTGQPRQRGEGSGWVSLVHPDDLARVHQCYNDSFDCQGGLALEFRLLHEDGGFRWIKCTASPRFDAEGNFDGLTGICTDMTEARMTEDRLRHSAKLESLGVLAGGIAHDFNNLLAGILGNASLALEDLPPGSPAVPLLEQIVKAGETAAQLTRQMLAYSGKGRFMLEPVDLSAQVRDIVTLIKASVPRTVELQLHLAPHLPKIQADPGQIQQLVMNLVINGAEAIGPTGYGRVEIATELVTVGHEPLSAILPGFSVPPGEYVILRVHDTGQGMDVSTKTRIFDPFFTTKFTGRGLGLAAASNIVRGHKGGIALDSEPGSGTEFRIYFPVPLEVTLDEVAEAEEPLAPAQGLSGTGTILVVDDQLPVLRMTSGILRKYGYNILTCRNGREAVDLFQAIPRDIDLVILDLTMPVLSGDLALDELRAIRGDIRILATSGFAEEDVRTRFGLGIDGFLAKPYRSGQLAEAVHGVLSKRQHRDDDDDD